MIKVNTAELAERFIRYARIDTQSDPQSGKHPSTEKQKDLSRLLVQELREMGIADAEMDEFGYVYATVASNTKKTVPVICFCGHVDTAPDCSGTGVKPLLHKNYDGSDIRLPDDSLQVVSPADQPYLKKKIGTDVITASGKTLLGADDKSGVAIIMQAAKYLREHPEVIHGKIRLLFTPDEEIGEGTAKVDMKRMGADYGYTLDGGEEGSLEVETFSADAAVITIHGVSFHPGYAKGRLVNALKIAGEILSALPKNGWSPETTEKMEGYVHPVRFEGIAEKAVLEFILRDFDDEKLAQHGERLRQIATAITGNHSGAKMDFEIKEQYRNMRKVLDQHPTVAGYAAEAIKRTGLEVKTESIRGGTDGSRFSYMGMPCPNIFTGMQGIHSKLEWVSVADMASAVETVIHLAAIWEENA